MEFSIVYTTYRPGSFDVLADSLQHQTFKDYELIVIDDFEVDRREVVRKYLESRGIVVSYVGPSKPKCFPELAANIMNAVNTGLLLSNGDTIVLLQDYIWLPPPFLQKIVDRRKTLGDKHCIVIPAHMWEDPRQRNNDGIISIWEQEWKGSPQANGCTVTFSWVPERWETACIAIPWSVVAAMNGFPECLDAYMAHPMEPVDKRFSLAGATPLTDTDNFMEMVNHREWLPHELWHQPKRKPKGSTKYVERENCFDLKNHVRGKVYWLEGTNIFDKPEYWCGELGYRPGADGVGYKDFPINQVKLDYLLSKKPGKTLDVGCAMGYFVGRLRKAGVDAWGMDISEYALSQAPAEVKPYLKVASADSLPFGDKEFDMVFSASTLEHLPTDIVAKTISEIKRVAKRGIIAVTPGDNPYFSEDITHKTKQPLSWWKEQFPVEFEIRSDADEEWLKLKQPEMVKLNLGSFVDVIPTWENIDILPLRQQIPPEIKFRQWDLRRGIPYPDNSVDLIRCSHLIEHLTLEEAKNLLKEVHRTLKPGGIVRISTPDAKIIVRHYQNQDMSFFNAIQPPEYVQAPTEGERLSLILFSGDYQRRAIYDYDMLRSFLDQAGFSKIQQVSPGFSQSEIMKSDTQDQHVEVSLIVECIR